jgi:hypothetical protein
MTIVQVREITIPPWSTIGHGAGFDIDTGDIVLFVGDHRPMRHLGDAICAARDEDDLPLVELADWQICRGES